MAQPKWKTQQLWKNRYRRPSGGDNTSYPGRTNGGTDFSTVPQTPGEVKVVNGVPQIVPTPPAPKPPAASPAAPPPPPRPTWTAPDYSNVPQDASYISGSTAANTAYNNAMTQLAAQRVASAEEYGFDPATGQVMENVDVTNPYSRAAMMNRSFQQRDRGRKGSYANQGQMLSGAFASALAADAFDSAQQRKGLERDFLSKMLDFKGQENAADATRAQTLAQLQAELVSRRMQEDAANSELVRSQLEAAQAEWDAKYGPKPTPQGPVNPPPTSGPSGPGPVGAPGNSWINPGNPFGTSGQMPANAGAIIAALAANPPKPQPRSRSGRRSGRRR